MTKVRLGVVQFEAQSDKAENYNKAIELIRKAANGGAQIICLQELFLTKYFCFEENEVHFDLADDLKGEFIDPFCALSRELDVVLVLSLFEKRTKGLYHNTAVVIDPEEGNLGLYRKMHIPDDPGFYEKYYFTPGDTGYKVFKTKYGTIGVLVCWDQWYPEAARLTALKGAEVIFYPTAIGWETAAKDAVKQEELNAWKTIQKSHAIANGVFVCAVNRSGSEEGTTFWGNSFVSNPMGTEIFSANREAELVQVVTIDLEEIEKYRRIWPYFRDRRIDSYDDLTKRYLDE